MNQDDNSNDEESEYDGPSKSQLKREAKEVSELGNDLVRLPVSVLNTFNLSDELLAAIKLAQNIKQNRGMKRQLQYVGKIMRQSDSDEIQKAYDDYFAQRYNDTKEFHLCEQWRDKFIVNEGDVFKEFLDQYPDADRQQLRTLQRNAIREAKESKPPKNSRLLFKYIKEVIGS